ncbi:tyrosine-type recombinase/integrase [Kibdelosporangium aridum]|uniref:tyrosine-type recombinase/integrase n=1 Tax=Kibdelosporangium aridum TaxID=2030 RepID=UPI00068EA465|nr:tyrosine-type recombinase/integrase [Kibdelosporangium aridum]
MRLNATLDELVQRHIALMSGATTTKNGYKGYHRNHISPLIGHHPLGTITAETIDEFYSELARCREHCSADPTTTPADASHECRPLSAASIRKIHFLLTAAYRSAMRWHWTTHNPATLASPPPKPRPRPQPPTPAEVTRILIHAWAQPDPMLGVATWTAIATGARRGELCALRWTSFDADRGVLHIRASVAHDGYGLVVKDTKLHQDREIALDRDTVALLVSYRDHCRRQATAHGTTLAQNGFIFSPAPDGSVCLAPASLGQRFHRLVASQGIKTTLHKLRHYNATELILANINLRTVAGRLGHLDCSTTLTTYTAWINEADQRASTQLVERLPLRLGIAPQHRRHAVPPPLPRSISAHIAQELRAAIIDRTYRPGQHLPTTQQLAAHYRVAASTVHHAVTQLAHWNLVTTTPGHPITVHPNPPTSIPEPATAIPPLTPPRPSRQAHHDRLHRHHTRRSQRQPHVAGNVRTGHSLQRRAA